MAFAGFTTSTHWNAGPPGADESDQRQPNASGPPAASACGPRGAPSTPLTAVSAGHVDRAAAKSSAGAGALHSSVPGESFASSIVRVTTLPVVEAPLTPSADSV